jgi:hypothetical protein
MSKPVMVFDAHFGGRGEATELPPWDCEWASERAADALRYLGRYAPEVLENTSVLEPHEEAAHQAAMRGDEVAYLEALRGYMKAGRDAALEIRRRAA